MMSITGRQFVGLDVQRASSARSTYFFLTWGKLLAFSGVFLVASTAASASAGARVAPARPFVNDAPPAAGKSGAILAQEKVGDWQITCVDDGKGRRCSLLQQLIDAKSNQRLLAVELSQQGDRLEGVAILPFGVALQRGLTVRYQATDAGVAVPFQTCLPAGCLAPLILDQAAIGQVDRSKVLLFSVAVPSGETANFSVPASGFLKASARVRVLGAVRP